MDLTLFHNPKAGDEEHDRKELTGLLQRHGHRVRYISTKKGGWKAALEDPADLFVIAGGDGTIAKVARKIAARTDHRIPLAILRLGSANNIATSLAIPEDAEEWIGQWDSARQCPFDVGLIAAGDDELAFLESAGLGLMAAMIEAKDADDFEGIEKVQGGLETLVETLDELEPQEIQLNVDGQQVAGSMLMLEVLNIPLVGPNLELGPADPGDGLFEVTYAMAAHREALAAWMRRCAEGMSEPAPLPSLRGRNVSVLTGGAPVHVDDEIWPKKYRKVTRIDLSLHQRPLMIVMP